MVPHGYGLNASVSVTQRSPKSAGQCARSRPPSYGRSRGRSPCVPSNTVRGPMKPCFASSAARRPACAAQPGCRRLVQAPSARYSMMPDAMLPAMPSASTIWRRSQFQRGADAGRGRHGAEHGGRMEAGLVHQLGRDEAEPAERLDADRDAQRAPTRHPDCAVRRPRARPARSPRRRAPVRLRRCRRNPRRARRCR